MRVLASAGVGMVVLVLVTGPASAMRAQAGKLTLHGELSWHGQEVSCPDGTPALTICREHRGVGVVPGLGEVSERLLLLVQTGTTECPGSARVVGFSGGFTVGSKGTIEITAGPSPNCQPEGQRVTLTFPSVTITGGSGIYAGASGTATLRKILNPGSIGAFGKDIWDGTLLVPGLAFDTTAPVFRGAASKTVVARRGVKQLRVAYRVSATDETDGAVPVFCLPRTGSRFKLGRTVVNCSTSDKSGNTARARFTVTVRARR